MSKLNAKQERFCEEYAVDSNGAQACIRAGYSPKAAKEQASRLLTKANVRDRIAELQAQHRARLDVTVESLTAELEEARALAIKKGHASAAVQATMGIAKLHGLLIDRAEVKTTSEMTLAEVRARIKEIEAELAEAGDEAVQAPTQH